METIDSIKVNIAIFVFGFTFIILAPLAALAFDDLSDDIEDVEINQELQSGETNYSYPAPQSTYDELDDDDSDVSYNVDTEPVVYGAGTGYGYRGYGDAAYRGYQYRNDGYGRYDGARTDAYHGGERGGLGGGRGGRR